MTVYMDRIIKMMLSHKHGTYRRTMEIINDHRTGAACVDLDNHREGKPEKNNHQCHDNAALALAEEDTGLLSDSAALVVENSHWHTWVLSVGLSMVAYNHHSSRGLQ